MKTWTMAVLLAAVLAGGAVAGAEEETAEQRNARMNLPPGAARQSGGMAAAQFQCIARIPDELMGFADDAAIDADATCQNPLFGAAPRSVGMLPQQPIQQCVGLIRFHAVEQIRCEQVQLDNMESHHPSTIMLKSY